MRREVLRGALFAVTVVSAIVAASCSRPKKAPTLYLPAAGTELNLQLRFPLHAVSGTEQSLSVVCEDAKAFLVSLDVDSAANPVWDHRFLVGLDGQLWGCVADPTQPCADQHILKSLPRPYRVAIEGIDVAPAGYTPASPHNVICRGVADSTIGMGDILATALPTPSAAPAPTIVPALAVSVDVPMLRIGAPNGLFTLDGPKADELAGDTLFPTALPLTRTPTGGVVVAGGGLQSNSIFEFEPWKIAYRPESASLAVRRINGVATSFVDSAGNPAVLFSGGRDNAGTRGDGEVFRPGFTTTQPIPGFTGDEHGFHSAVFVPTLGAHPRGAIVVGGSCSPNFTSGFKTSVVQFLPVSNPNDMCATSSGNGRAQFCNEATNGIGDGGHCGMASGLIQTSSGPRILFGLGFAAQPSPQLSSAAYSFDYGTSLSTAFGGAAFGVAEPGTAALSSNAIGYFGGYAGATPSSNWGIFRGRDLMAFPGATGLQRARASVTATRLLDRSILVVGGGTSLELFTPVSAAMTSGAFAFAKRHLNQNCVNGLDPETCALFPSARDKHQVASPVRGSATWLNGTVVISGGANTLARAEIFVPAYSCSGANPVRTFDQVVVEGADFCDRGRTGLVLDDPAAPN